MLNKEDHINLIDCLHVLTDSSCNYNITAKELKAILIRTKILRC